MNISGKAVIAVLKKKQLVTEELLLIYDDIDLPLGTIRFRKNGGTGGHHGVNSVVEHLCSSNFSRLRIGIGRGESSAPKDYVLSEFSEDERNLFSKVLGNAVAGVKTVLHRDMETAMNEYNRLQITV